MSNTLGKTWKLSLETKRKMSEAKKGEKCYLWEGGITPKNKLIRSSFNFTSWRISVFERDKFLCQMPDCDKTERYLNAHHIKTFAQYPELRFEINNGITLCKKCHNKTKKKEEQFENLLLEINKSK